MKTDVLTVQENTPIEQAARLLADHKVGSLPVLRGEELVGIITETDLFRIMLEMLGARHPGVYLTVLTPNRPGEIAKLSRAIFEYGGDITALSTFEGDTTADFMISLKVSGVEQKDFPKIIEPLGIKLLEIGTN
jgi:acetoin utilization protein AcuB